MNLCKFENLIKNPNNFFAHTRLNENDAFERELLTDHLKKTGFYFNKLIEEKKLYDVFTRIYKEIFDVEDYIDLYLDMVYALPYFHDLGKINPKFQQNKMNNRKYKDIIGFEDSKHSEIGALIYFNYFFSETNKLMDSNLISEKYIIRIYKILLFNYGLIKSHHSFLKTEEQLLNDLKNYYMFIQENEFIKNTLSFSLFEVEKDYFDYFVELIPKMTKNGNIQESLYIYQRLIFGVLIQSDVLATVDYTNKIKTNDFGFIKNIKNWIDVFENYSVIKSIRETEVKLINNSLIDNGKDINILRTKMFLEAESNIDNKSNLFQLEAPTGAGKTVMSLNLALKLISENKDLNKVFYAFPYNTLVEQTYDTIIKIFGDNQEIINQIDVINSERAFDDIDESESYEKLYNDYQFLYTPFVLSTNVKLFDILFGDKKTSYYPLPLLANSLVILDEIQTYKNSIWEEMVLMLYRYSKLLNIKIIIMSATLPDLSYFLELSYSNKIRYIKPLIKDRDLYFSDERFKERVKLDFSMLSFSSKEETEIFCKIIEIANNHSLSALTKDVKNIKINKAKKFLIEFIKKKTAIKFYKFILDNLILENQPEIFLITGDTSVGERKKIINKIKSWDSFFERDLILIGTQTVEAGVDISMDVGFKNISLLDSEEQFLGRINRSFENSEGIAYFFDLDDIDKIYKNDVRSESHCVLKQEDIMELLINKDFKTYYSSYILKGIRNKNKNSSYKGGKKKYEILLESSNHRELNEHFKLIDDVQKQALFIANNDLNPDIDFDNLWENYVDLINDRDMSFAERKICIMRHRQKMAPYIYEVSKYNNLQEYSGYCGGIYYIKDGEKYFENKIFNPDILNSSNEYDFL